MPSMRGIFQVVAVAVTLALSPSQAALECRQPNYVTRDGKIFSQDPATPGLENEITIRGVTWSGMEKDNMIPDGLWGSTNPSATSVYGTKVSTLLEFFKNNSINSVRLPLNADFLIKNSFPQLAYIHGYENRELTIWADPNSVTYFDLLGRMIQVLQTEKISVLLDINLLTNYPQDAFWYTAPYVNITESPTYKAVSYLAKAFCNSTYWNVLGIDLKDEMSDVLWNADPKEADVTNDWHGAAEILANRVLELCPSWLVFVGGASSPTDAQRFSVGKDYETLSSHWDGGNLHNATKNPLKINTGNKIVFAPHAHSHGKLPQNYFYSANSNCTRNSPTDYYGLENSEIDSECVDFIEGKKVKSKYSCTSTEFGCSSYEHLTAETIAKNYQKVMDEAIGDVVKEGKTPVIFGSFSGVYGAQTQPHQTAALDFLINYAATNLRGGYFWALNPDTEYFLEDSTNPKKGLFGKTHYGIFTARSWQVANEDLLTALAKIPSSPIQCYGEKSKGKSDASPLRADVTVALGSAVVTMLYAMW